MKLDRKPTEELVFVTDYKDVFADLVAPGAMKIGNEDYFRFTFIRHKLTPTQIPSMENVDIPVIFEKEAQCSVSIPKSVALELAKAINGMLQPEQESQEG
ncbi:hypothetical protein ACOMDP_11850 [Pantoea dispersa]|uniref:hypothetical protein n=1 Tax=Pantoea dispersa TaxID=59814 RepID=UPI003B7EA7C4